MIRFLILALTCAACGSAIEPCGPTPDSTYIQSAERLSGNCGPMPNVVINTTHDGTITFPSNIICQTQVQDGCMTAVSNCGFANNGISCLEEFEVTFTQDGTSSEGSLILSCTMSSGKSCMSDYSISMVQE